MGGVDITRIAGFFFFVVVLLCFVSQCSSIGDAQCTPNKLNITQKQISPNEDQWNVTITNECICSLSNVKLTCLNFEPKNKIDPSIISKYDSTHCLVSNNGQPLFTTESIVFTYVAAKATFAPFDYQVACS